MRPAPLAAAALAALVVLTAALGPGVPQTSVVAVSSTSRPTTGPASALPPATDRADDPQGPPSEPVDETGPIDLRFLSSPDFLNNDVADARTEPGFRPGNPNSWDASYVHALGTVMSAWRSEGAKDVLVAGDLVEGHWGIDTHKTGTFGALTNQASRVRGVKRAAELYYGAWTDRFRASGLRPLPAIGDHELGDNPWEGGDWYQRFKRAHVDLFKAQFARYVVAPGHFATHPATGPAAGTAYATYLSPEVLVVSVDEFTHTASHHVALRLDDAQLAWLDSVLDDAVARGVDWIVVQGHLPVVGPNRHHGSSSLMYDGGTASPFWRTMVEHHVDVYLNGEVHAITAHHVDGITEISHGGIFGWGLTNYLVADVRGDQMMLTAKEFAHDPLVGPRLWQTDGHHEYPPRSIRYRPQPYVRGRIVVTRDNEVLDRRGILRVYHGG